MPRRIGVVGCGRWGSKHLQALRQIAQKESIEAIVACDVDTVALQKARSMGFQVHDDPETLVKLFQLDAVVIATPNGSHYHLGKQFLQQRVDVFLEKPIAETFEHASSLVATAIQEGKTLKTGFLLRFHPCLVNVRERIRKGEIGAIQSMEYLKKSMRAEDGVSHALDSLAIHGVDLAEFLLDGQGPTRISEINGSRISTNLTLEYPNQVEVRIDVGWNSDTNIGKISIVGTEGSILVTLDNHQKFVVLREQKQSIVVDSFQTPLEGVLRDFLQNESLSSAASTGSILRTINCIDIARQQLAGSGSLNTRELKR